MSVSASLLHSLRVVGTALVGREARPTFFVASIVTAGVAVGALVRRWRNDGTIDDILERVAFQIWRYAQKYELRCRPKRIFLLRHGESEGNIDKTVSHATSSVLRFVGMA